MTGIYFTKSILSLSDMLCYRPELILMVDVVNKVDTGNTDTSGNISRPKCILKPEGNLGLTASVKNLAHVF